MTRQKRADEQFCRYCGEVIKKKAEICPNCGVRPGTPAETSSSGTYCPSCGEAVRNEAELCPGCGTRLTRSRWQRWVQNDRVTRSNLLTALGGFFLFLAVTSLVGDGNLIVSIVEAVLFGSIGAVLLPPVREKLSFKYPFTTIGRKRTVAERATGNVELPCSICLNPVEQGVVRTRTEEYVLFGFALVTFEREENYYCDDCVSDVSSELKERL